MPGNIDPKEPWLERRRFLLQCAATVGLLHSPHRVGPPRAHAHSVLCVLLEGASIEPPSAVREISAGRQLFSEQGCILHRVRHASPEAATTVRTLLGGRAATESKRDAERLLPDLASDGIGGAWLIAEQSTATAGLPEFANYALETGNRPRAIRTETIWSRSALAPMKRSKDPSKRHESENDEALIRGLSNELSGGKPAIGLPKEVLSALAAMVSDAPMQGATTAAQRALRIAQVLFQTSTPRFVGVAIPRESPPDKPGEAVNRDLMAIVDVWSDLSKRKEWSTSLQLVVIGTGSASPEPGTEKTAQSLESAAMLAGSGFKTRASWKSEVGAADLAATMAHLLDIDPKTSRLPGRPLRSVLAP